LVERRRRDPWNW